MMTLKPAFEIGLWNAWLFMIIFLLQWLAVIVFPGHFTERTGHPGELQQDRKGRVMGGLTQGLWIGATLYSIFLPLRAGTAWFYVGLGFFAFGLTMLLFATLAVYRMIFWLLKLCTLPARCLNPGPRQSRLASPSPGSRSRNRKCKPPPLAGRPPEFDLCGNNR